LNKPAALTGWRALVYFWDGGWLGVGWGGSGTVPPHSHHAAQISIGLDGPIAMRPGDGEWQELRAGAVQPDAEHAFDPRGRKVAMLFVDPESHEGRWLSRSLKHVITELKPEKIAGLLPALSRFDEDLPSEEEATRLIGHVVRAACAGPPPIVSHDERIHKALAFIRSAGSRQLSQEEVAREVFLSPSRFAHLFTEEMGLPFRRFLLWRKVMLAMAAFGRGGTLSEAAHEAGFADSAHLTRTWHQMFGLPPSLMMGAAKFYEIPSPFASSAATPSRRPSRDAGQ